MKAAWMRAMERTVRRLERDLPIDELLPELESGHLGDEAAPEPAAEATAAPAETGPVETPAPEASPESSPEELQAEIQEFMNRNQRGLAEDDDFAEYLGGGIDPNAD